MTDALKVILVEDDASARAALASAVLRSSGLQLLGAASDVDEGLALLAREQPDVLLVDLGLRGQSGLEVIRAAMTMHPECEVIVVSALGDEAHVLAAIEAGATGYLLKDASAAELVAQIGVLKSGGSPVSPVIARRLLTRLSTARTTPQAELGPDPKLSAQEHQVLKYSALGYSADEIALQMGVSRHTVGTYIKRSYRKLQAHSKAQALLQAQRHGLL